MKTRIIFFAAAALLLSACVKEAGQISSDFAGTTLRAYQEVAVDSKTTVLNGGTQVYWEPNDEIEIFLNGTGYKFVTNITEPATVADFTESSSNPSHLELLPGSTEALWGLYPFSDNAVSDGKSVTTTLPAVQTGRADSFDKDTHVTLALASVNNPSLTFCNVTGGLRFSLTQEGIKTIRFEGNRGEALAGRIMIACDNNLPVVVGIGSREAAITLTAPDDGTFQTGVWYYIDVVPRKLTGGFKMVFSKEGTSAVLASSNSVEIKRGIYGSIANVDAGLEFKAQSVADAVDMGLSVKWASWNVGASKPEEYGNRFAWGETLPKNNYHWDNYKFPRYVHVNGEQYFFASYDFVDDKYILESEDDAATANWGGQWRMPTEEEYEELLDEANSSWTWTTENGVHGYRVTSKKTSNSIFFPAAGYHMSGDAPLTTDEYGWYWSANLYTESATYAYCLGFLATDAGISRAYRARGLSVRPVYGERTVPVSGIYFSRSPLYSSVGESEKLVVYVKPANATVRKVTWTSSDPSVASVDADGTVHALKMGEAVITVKSKSGGRTDECLVIVSQTPQATVVDLGLSVYWASWNVGASAPEESGYHLAWGESEPKENYSWNNYAFWLSGTTDSTIKLSKYVAHSASGTIDNKTTLDSGDDVAATGWFGSWHIPTRAEWDELRSTKNCTWTWETLNGVKGFRVTSKKEGYTDKSIFLPAAGRYSGSTLNYAGSNGYYWSSDLYTTNMSDSNNATLYSMSSSGVSLAYGKRYQGRSVRPVWPK